jgi:hypothetical protein
VNTNLVCIVCFGTNDQELARFTTLRLNPKLDRQLARTMVDSVIYYWSNGGQTSSTFQNVVLVDWIRKTANRIYRHRLPSTQNRKSKWVSKKAIKALILALAILGTDADACAGSFRVHYTIRWNGRDITVQADVVLASQPSLPEPPEDRIDLWLLGFEPTGDFTPSDAGLASQNIQYVAFG